jgi:hypothetical protein
MAIYDSIDFKWTWDGDYVLGQDGDIADSGSSGDYLESLITEVHTVLRSEFGDWQYDPNLGTNLSDFVGEPNSRENGQQIEQRIQSRLVAAQLLRPEDVIVKVIPTGKHEIFVTITVNATSTPLNKLEPGSSLIVSLVYDTLEDNVFFLDQSESARQAGSF